MLLLLLLQLVTWQEDRIKQQQISVQLLTQRPSSDTNVISKGSEVIMLTDKHTNRHY